MEKCRDCNASLKFQTKTDFVKLPISGKTKFEDWMNGLCLGCIEGVFESIGEFSETPLSDYIDSSELNKTWDNRY